MKFLDYPELELLSRALTFEAGECRVFTRIEAYNCKSAGKERKLMKSIEDTYGGTSGSVSSSVSSKGDAKGTAGYSANSAIVIHDEDGADTAMQFVFEDGPIDSPFGPLDQPSARKMLFLLITCLNSAFPDHDFSTINPSSFSREESPTNVLSSLSHTLGSLRGSSGTPRSFSSLPNGYESLDPNHGQNSSGSFSSSSGGGLHPHSYRTAPCTSPNFGSAAAAAIANTSKSSGSSSLPALGAVLEDIMAVSECEVFLFKPDLESDPHASGEPDSDEDELAYGDNFEDEYWSGEEGYADEPAFGAPGRMVDMFNEKAAGGLDSPARDSTRDTTPRPGGSTENGETTEEESEDDEDRGSDYDDPLFDEDYTGGFNGERTRSKGSGGRKTSGAASSSMSSFETPDSPRTPVSIRRDYFAGARNGAGKDDRFLPPSRLREKDSLTGARTEEVEEVVDILENDDSMDADTDEAYDASVGSVLWTTYAFFYNKRLKRILFVNVWARRNPRYTEMGTSPSYRSYHPEAIHHVSSAGAKPLRTAGSAAASARAARNRIARKKLGTPNIVNVATPSPAKRAIQKAEGEGQTPGRRTRRGRTHSSSPGPSSMSPFPHDAPRTSIGSEAKTAAA